MYIYSQFCEETRRGKYESRSWENEFFVVSSSAWINRMPINRSQWSSLRIFLCLRRKKTTGELFHLFEAIISGILVVIFLTGAHVPAEKVRNISMIIFSNRTGKYEHHVFRFNYRFEQCQTLNLRSYDSPEHEYLNSIYITLSALEFLSNIPCLNFLYKHLIKHK
jgi:hypothetical protein